MPHFDRQSDIRTSLSGRADPPTAYTRFVSRTITGASVRAYLARDWDAARERKRTYWSDRLVRGGLAEALRVTEQLRAWMKSLDPDWPSKEDREEDLETHRRVAAALARTAPPVATTTPVRARPPRGRARRVR